MWCLGTSLGKRKKGGNTPKRAQSEECWTETPMYRGWMFIGTSGMIAYRSRWLQVERHEGLGWAGLGFPLQSVGNEELVDGGQEETILSNKTFPP